MVKNRNKGRRTTDKVNKLNGYFDASIKTVITVLIAFGVSNVTTISSDIAVIKVSYENATKDIAENKGMIKEQDVCIKDHEKRLFLIEKS